MIDVDALRPGLPGPPTAHPRRAGLLHIFAGRSSTVGGADQCSPASIFASPSTNKTSGRNGCSVITGAAVSIAARRGISASPRRKPRRQRESLPQASLRRAAIRHAAAVRRAVRRQEQAMLDTGSPGAARMPRAPSHRAGVQERLRIRASECGAFGAVPAYVMCTRQATKKIAGACFRDAGLGRRSRTLWRGSDREPTRWAPFNHQPSCPELARAG